MLMSWSFVWSRVFFDARLKEFKGLEWSHRLRSARTARASSGDLFPLAMPASAPTLHCINNYRVNGLIVSKEWFCATL